MEIWDGYYRDGTLVRGEKIPRGIYNIACEVLVRHTDGDYLLMRRDPKKAVFGGYYEATAGGAARKGENPVACIKRELFEETGILEEDFTEITKVISDDEQNISYYFLCVTDCDKNGIVLQQGETVDYKWLSEKEFFEFLSSEQVIELQGRLYREYFRGLGYDC